MPEHTAYIGVGSNIEPERHIPLALARLAAATRLEAVSTFYRTAPLDRPEQPPFYNGVVRVRTTCGAGALKSSVLRKIEDELGRARTGDRCAARTIDLDILLFDDAIIREPGLEIPDPDIARRVFIAAPLLELAPGLILPDTGAPLAQAACLAERPALCAMPEFTRRLKERFEL